MTPPLRFPNAVPSVPENPLVHARSFSLGFTDELGDRHVALDAEGTAFLEVLRVRPDLASANGFEPALRARVDAIGHVHHPSLAIVYSVEQMDALGLSLVSNHTPGRRLSELAPTEHGPALALELIRAVTPALAALQQAGAGVAHGTLSAERIVMTPTGGFVVVDHVLGPAIESLELSRTALNSLGIVVPGGIDRVRFEGRTDVIQLGFMALALLLQRHLDPAEYPAGVPALLDEFVMSAGSPPLAAKMRVWLERAMQIGPRPFASARDAQNAFDTLPNDIEVQRAESARALLAFRSEEEEVKTAAPEVKPTQPAAVAPTEPPVASVAVTPPPSTLPGPVPSASRPRRTGRIVAWVIAALVVLAAAEAAAIFLLAPGRSAVDVIEVRSPLTPPTGSPVSIPVPPNAPVPSQAESGQPAAPGLVPVPQKTPAAAPVSTAASAATAAQRFGGLTVSSVIDLQVLMDGKLIGSNAGPMAVNEGSHNFEFVNEILGFRLVRNMDVRNGQMSSVNVPVPNGRVSINATPWAEVTIDGTPAGETPIANFSIPIGTHEVVFRHPQLGERKQTVVIKVGALVRVTQAFEQVFKH